MTTMRAAIQIFILVLVSLAVCPAAKCQPIDLKQVVTGNTVNDPLFGVSFTFPAGWEVVDAQRWGKGENTFWFKPMWPSNARPAAYYRHFSADAPRPTDINAYFTEQALAKETSRRAQLRTYHNVPDSFRITKLGDYDAFSYWAAFKANGQELAEYIVRVVGPNGYAMFFTQGELKDIKAIRERIDSMAASVRLP